MQEQETRDRQKQKEKEQEKEKEKEKAGVFVYMPKIGYFCPRPYFKNDISEGKISPFPAVFSPLLPYICVFS